MDLVWADLYKWAAICGWCLWAAGTYMYVALICVCACVRGRVYKYVYVCKCLCVKICYMQINIPLQNRARVHDFHEIH